MQKRLIRKLDLEILLSQIKPHPSPKPSLEQYTIPADVAANMLYIAAYTYDDIIGKEVLDLGCGTGRLALGASFLGARQVVGIDIDRTAIKTALENSVNVGLKSVVQWVVADIKVAHGSFDTVLQNPPFGVQKRKADRQFLEKALEVGRTIYSLHNSLSNDKQFIKKMKSSGGNIMRSSPSPFLEKFIKEHGGKIIAVYAMMMSIPHMFNFHTKRKHEFIVDLYVIKGK